MLTAPKISENEMIRYKSAKETSLLEIKEVERGKPREWETQILVGELWEGNWTDSRTRTWLIKILFLFF